jgi:LPXTG-site transpeptidase (sortase) family protein
VVFRNAPPGAIAPEPITFAEVKAENPQKFYVPEKGAELGTLSVTGAADIRDIRVFFDDEAAQLSQGAGIYTGGFAPGNNRMCMIAAHNNTYFRTLPQAEPGDIVTLDLAYGRLVYEVTGQQEARFDDESAFDLLANEESLILYTCTNSIPFGATPWRIFVYCKYLPEQSEIYE